MVSKFKSLSALEEILARGTGRGGGGGGGGGGGQFWETIPTLKAISGSEAARSGELPIYQVCLS